MSTCPRCSKRVFFAEQKTSFGKDWHSQCLKCATCQTVLHPGQHAEYKGLPYCNIPCFKSLCNSLHLDPKKITEQLNSSPNLLKRAKSNPSKISQNNNINNVSMNTPLKIDGKAPRVNETELEQLKANLQTYNSVHPNHLVSMVEKDGHVSLEGPLRIHWGIQTPIRFKEDDSKDSPPLKSRKYNRVAKAQSFHSDVTKEPDSPNKDPFSTMKAQGIPVEQVSSQELLAVKMRRGKFHTVRANKLRRRCSINGHVYSAETSSNFTPPFGSVAKLHIHSHLKSIQVVEQLLDKFKIENGPDGFAFYMVKANGEMWPLDASAYPLMERVNLPDSSARLFFMDKPHEVSKRQSIAVAPKNIELMSVWKPVIEEPPVTQEVADYANLPDPMLQAFLDKFEKEKTEAVEQIKEKYCAIERVMKQVMAEKQLTQETYL